MDWGGTGDVRYNNRRYHALADEYPIYSERYDANERRIFELASRPSCPNPKNQCLKAAFNVDKRLNPITNPKGPDLKTAFDADKRLNPDTYRVRFRQMFEDAVECQRICGQ